MKRLLWFVLGAAVMVSGQAMAQWFNSTDGNGNSLSGFHDNASGFTTWQDSHGHAGSMYAPGFQPVLPVLPHNPC